MVVDAANLNGGHLVLAGNAADIGPDPIFNFRPDQINTTFCAENNVKINLRICVGHIFMRSLTRRGSFIPNFRGLKHHGYIQTVAMRRKSYVILSRSDNVIVAVAFKPRNT